MKREFECPEIQLTQFSVEDVITLSNAGAGDGEKGPWGDLAG